MNSGFRKDSLIQVIDSLETTASDVLRAVKGTPFSSLVPLQEEAGRFTVCLGSSSDLLQQSHLCKGEADQPGAMPKRH